MRQRNPSKGKSNFSEKRSKSSSYSREGKPAFKKEGDGKRSYGKPAGEGRHGDDKKPSYKRESASYGDKPKRSYGSSEEKRPYKKTGGGYDNDRPKRSYGSDEKRTSFKKDEGGYGKSDRSYSDRPKRSFDGEEKRPYKKTEGAFGNDRPKRKYSSDEERPSRKTGGAFGKSDRSYSDRPKRRDDGEEKRPYKKTEGAFGKPGRSYGDKPFTKEGDTGKRAFYKRADGSYASTPDGDHAEKPKRTYGSDSKAAEQKDLEGKHRRSKRSFEEAEQSEGEAPELSYTEKKHLETYEKLNKKKKKVSEDGTIRLNRYIANAGICSRREADVLIASGVVTVNGKVVTEMGTKILPGDLVTYDGSAIKNEDKKYLLLNKPKDYITTMDDPEERKTVMELVKNACKERLYPVGRLDRNTTGLLLFTNDGDMTAKLTHPKHNIRKVYHVTINKKISPDDFKTLSEGVELEDGFIKPDAIEYVEEGKKDLGVEIHSGRNRIVRRLFEHLGYEVVKLDRVAFAGLTKKDVPRGKWRFLTPKEVSFLKMLK